MLFSRYKNIDYFLELEWIDFVDSVNFAINEKQEEILIQRWIPFQSEISFEEFKKSLKKEKQRIIKKDDRTSDELFKLAEDVLLTFKGGDES